MSGVYHVGAEEALDLEGVARVLRRPLVEFSPGALRLLGVARWVLRRRELGGLAEALLPFLEGGAVLDSRKVQRDTGYRFRYTSAAALSEHARSM